MTAETTAVKMDDSIGFRLDDEIAAMLEEYRGQFKFPPNKSDIGRQALREFLERELTDDED